MTKEDLAKQLLKIAEQLVTADDGLWKLYGEDAVEMNNKRTTVKGTARVYTPGPNLPKALAKSISYVAVVTPEEGADPQFYWGGSGYVAQGVKRTFGMKQRLTSKFQFTDLGAPIGEPQEMAEEKRVWTVVFGAK